MKRALITGITGQDGSYLAELLLEKNYEVHGLIRRASLPNTERIDHLLPRLVLHYGDMTDYGGLANLVAEIAPTEVYNLAAQSHVGISFTLPEYTAEATGVGTLKLFEAIRRLGSACRLYQASTSELYGGLPETAPQSETTPFYPKSPYGVAKLYAYWITKNYREAYGMYAVNGILFNHESPRRGVNFVTRKITLAVANILKGRQPKLLLGNLDAKRDWGFAGDYVRGMYLMLQQERPDDYVLATGQTHTVREFAEQAFKAAGIDLTWQGEGVNERGVDRKGRVLVEIDPALFRPAEVDLLLGNPAKAERELGWQRQVDFPELVNMMVKAELDKNNHCVAHDL